MSERLEEILNSIGFVARSYTGVMPLIEFAKQQAKHISMYEDAAESANDGIIQVSNENLALRGQVQELEHDKEHLELIKERQEEEYRNVYEQNKR